MNALTQNLTRNLREYGMMAALVIIVIVFALGGQIRNLFQNVSTQISNSPTP